MAKRGKKYMEALKKIDKAKLYSPREAIELLKELSYANFDETVEVHIRLGVDPRHSDQQVRGVVQLPHGLGKKIKVLVFAQGEAERIAKEAGADYAGGDEYIKKIEKDGWLDFDVALATPDMMPKIGKLGKILGRRGLMPNPKAGTLVKAEDLPKVIEEARKGRVEFKMDRTAIIHVPIGKLSFDTDKLLANLAALIDSVLRAKPPGAKGQYMKSITITSTMGPGLKLDLKEALSLPSAIMV